MSDLVRASGSRRELEQFIRDGVYKRLNYLDSPQAARVRMEGRGEVIILSSNNYLGLEQRARGRRGRQGGASTASAPAPRRCGSSAARSPSIATLEEALRAPRRHRRRRSAS